MTSSWLPLKPWHRWCDRRPDIPTSLLVPQFEYTYMQYMITKMTVLGSSMNYIVKLSLWTEYQYPYHHSYDFHLVTEARPKSDRTRTKHSHKSLVLSLPLTTDWNSIWPYKDNYVASLLKQDAPLTITWINITTAWITSIIEWDEITYPFPKLNSTAV